MAAKIRLLSDEVIGKIAAGEVVERPSAAIKEMVENSLDAGASAVTVEIRDGGISYFRVTDNGSGIHQSDIRMAFERHATSKISSAQELAAIQTLGFRGEALASIAAVAKVTCTTRTKQDTSGIKAVNQGGRIESIEEAACPEGTTFIVRDLFFNTPVRLKFLKKPAIEAGYVTDLMMRLILSRPDVSFRYINQGKTLYHSAGDGKLASAVFSIYGKEIRNMAEVNGHQGGVLLKGYVSTADNGRASRAHQSFFINGRFMKSGTLSAAVEAACRERLPAGRYPSCVLHLTMPFELVDVNVHPNKLECRFQNDTAIAEAVESIIKDAFDQKSTLEQAQKLQLAPSAALDVMPVTVKRDVIPTERQQIEKVSAAPVMAKEKQAIPLHTIKHAEVGVNREIVKESTRETVKPALKPLQPLGRSRSVVLHESSDAVQTYMQSYQQPVAAVLPQRTHSQSEINAKPIHAESFLPPPAKEMKIIGTAFDSYIIVEYGDSLLLVDQQGVHERLLFDQMMASLDTQTVSQELLVPLVVSATRKEQQLLENHSDLLQAIGLVVEPFGENEVAVRSIPMVLGQPQACAFVREIISQLESERGIISLEKRRAGIVAIACRRAVRKGERLQESDLRSLVERMVEKNITPASPRGTPLIVAMTRNDIDRRFRRLQ